MAFERMSVLDRSKNYCVLSIKDEPTVRSYQVLAANTLDAAFTGGDIIVPPNQSSPNGVLKGNHFVSTGLRRKRLFYTSDNTRGQTRMVFDFDEFQGVSFPITPTDEQFAYLTIQRELITTGAFTAVPSPIYVVPNAAFNNMQTPSATIAGTAPVVGSTANGDLPLDGSMEIILPRFIGSFQLRNLDSANSLYFSFGLGMAMVELPFGQSTSLTGTQSDSLVLAGEAGTIAFNLIGGVENASI